VIELWGSQRCSLRGFVLRFLPSDCEEIVKEKDVKLIREFLALARERTAEYANGDPDFFDSYLSAFMSYNIGTKMRNQMKTRIEYFKKTPQSA
jgi:hypothetical protein